MNEYAKIVRLFLALATAVFGAFVSNLPLAQSQGLEYGDFGENSVFGFSIDVETPILRFARRQPMIGGEDNAQTCTVYGNGLVEVHVPVYMRKAGDYSMTLQPGQLRDLLSKLAKKGIFDIDAESMRRQKHAAMRSRADRVRSNSDDSALSLVVDDHVLEIEIRLDFYAPADTSKSVLEDIDKKIYWQGPKRDAELYPDIRGIAQLSEVERILESLLEHEDLTRSNHE